MADYYESEDTPNGEDKVSRGERLCQTPGVSKTVHTLIYVIANALYVLVHTPRLVSSKVSLPIASELLQAPQI